MTAGSGFMRLAAALLATALATAAQAAPPASWFDNKGRQDVESGGVRTITVQTPKGPYRVWTKRVGNNPKVKVLLLHGGPGGTHEYFEAADTRLPAAGVEYYYYDQLGSGNSDKPDDTSLWTLPRFVDEVEQVRSALGLTKENFCLLGHSWGGILAIEYTLTHQDKVKCLIVSNMMDSTPAYDAYAKRVLMPKMDQAKLAEVKKIEAEKRTAEPRYMELLMPMHYEQHILRRPAAEWPEPVQRSFSRTNQTVYTLMQGPSELGLSGRLEGWDRSGDRAKITVPTLVIAGEHDTMDPAWMRAMAKGYPNGRLTYCPDGSHMSMYDDQERYFAGLIEFLQDVEAGKPAKD